MAETAVSFALGEVFQILKEETKRQRGIHKDFSDIKDELESIQAFLKDADRRAADEANSNEGIRIWVKQVREASFRIEDVIDEYLRVVHVVQHRGCGANSIGKITSLIKTLISRHGIATEIQDIKLSLSGIKERSERIIITTRVLHVAEFFKKSFLVHVHNLKLLPPDKAWELFSKKAFRFELHGQCPAELEGMSNEIVRKCKGLPLAIVAIGGLLSTKSKTVFEWQK
ncbi:Disease resistance protein RPM1, partial [Mucuna pruriens]